MPNLKPKFQTKHYKIYYFPQASNPWTVWDRRTNQVVNFFPTYLAIPKGIRGDSK